MKEKTINKKTKFTMTLANKLTVLRIISIPAVVISMIEGHVVAFYTLFSLSMLTDLFDGLAARIRGEQTPLGAFLDPMADKLLMTSVYLTMAFLHKIDMWVFVVIFSRDLLIVLGWGVIHILTGSSPITPRILGKVTTAIQMISVIVLTYPVVNHTVYRILIWSMVGITIASVIDYIVLGEKRLGDSL